MGPKKINIAVLISGRGSNLQALIQACSDIDFPAKIKLVISNAPEAAGLIYAKQADIKTLVINNKDYKNKSDFEERLTAALETDLIDLVCLAGFMQILGVEFVNHWKDKIVNIHPSLLPSYKGLNTHKRVLEDGCDKTGCTVHFVRPEVDSGPIVVQKVVDVKKGDTEENLAKRVLEQEHIAYPEAIRIIAEKYFLKNYGQVVSNM